MAPRTLRRASQICVAPRFALWSDSTYAYIEHISVLEQTESLGFPLHSFSCMYGAGLTQPGNMKGIVLEAAATVIIEMGYNDNGTLEPTEAVKLMRKMSWLE